ncbi:MAG: hypothetical protein AAB683_01345 [Patescibacteria group bacterium]
MMKKILILVILLVVISAIFWKYNSSNTPVVDTNAGKVEEVTVSVPSKETVKVSDKISEYKNNELGFSVKYPTLWNVEESVNGVSFFVPTEKEIEKNTVRNLKTDISVISGKCAFPPVTTVKERDTLKVGDLSYNMISIANTVQGTNYFNRMYSLQSGSICYLFTFTSIISSPTGKGYSAADVQKIGSTNKTLVDTADTQFKDMINSFKFIKGPDGQDETKASPKK